MTGIASQATQPDPAPVPKDPDLKIPDQDGPVYRFRDWAAI